MPGAVTTFGGLGPIPSPAAPAGTVTPPLAWVGTDFWRSSGFGLLLLLAVWLYMTKRIL